jgi:hypothetical protein
LSLLGQGGHSCTNTPDSLLLVRLPLIWRLAASALITVMVSVGYCPTHCHLRASPIRFISSGVTLSRSHSGRSIMSQAASSRPRITASSLSEGQRSGDQCCLVSRLPNGVQYLRQSFTCYLQDLSSLCRVSTFPCDGIRTHIVADFNGYRLKTLSHCLYSRPGSSVMYGF